MKNLLLLSLLVLFGCSKEDNTELIDSYTSQISSLNSQLSQLNSQLTQSQSQITSLQSQVNNISGLEATIDNLNTQITDYQSQVSSLQSQISTLNSQVSSNSDLQSTLDGLNAQLASKDALISSLQAQIETLENAQSTSSSNSNSNDSDNWPDYHAQGHSMEAVSIWRLATRGGLSVAEAQRFNVKIYPDNLIPNKLTSNGQNQSGFLDIGDNIGIPFNYSFGKDGNTCCDTGNFIIDSSLLNGVTSNASNFEVKWYQPTNLANPNDYIKIHIPSSNYDNTLESGYYENLIFYRID